ncbi:MAG: AI-2E family transporter [Myxococcota bacterium]
MAVPGPHGNTDQEQDQEQDRPSGVAPVSSETAQPEQGSKRSEQVPAVVTITTNVNWRWLMWLVGSLAFIAFIIWVLAQVPAVSIPLLLAMGIAYVLHPAVDWMARWGIGRTWAIVVLVGAMVTVLVVFGLIFVPVLIEQIRQLPEQIDAKFDKWSPWIEDTLKVHLPESAGASFRVLGENLSEAYTRLGKLLGQTPTLGEVVSSGTSSVLTVLVGVMLVPVLVAYFLRDYPKIRGWFEDAVPRQHHDRFVAHMTAIDRALSGFVRGQGVVALILAVLYAIGFYIVGLPLALLVAVISGLGNYVPYLGTAFGIVLATAITLLGGHGWLDLVFVYAVFAVVQFIEGWFITPRVVGDRVGLSPVAVIFFVLLFSELFGFFGVLIAVPVTAVLKILFASAFKRYKQSVLYSRQ